MSRKQRSEPPPLHSHTTGTEGPNASLSPPLSAMWSADPAPKTRVWERNFAYQCGALCTEKRVQLRMTTMDGGEARPGGAAPHSVDPERLPSGTVPEKGG